MQNPDPYGTAPGRRTEEAAGSVDDIRWGVGAVSRRLGIATPTLRTWDRRYGLGPSTRTKGGHRRYSELDVVRLARMSQLIADGVPPAHAAMVCQHTLRAVPAPDAVPAGVVPAGVVASLDDVALGPDVDAWSLKSLMRATRELDAASQSSTLARVFDRHGIRTGWSDVVSPWLVAVGEAWARGELGIEAEHVASDCVLTELRHQLRQRRGQRHGQRHGRRSPPARVLLAGAADDLHTMPLVALAVTLADLRIDSQVLGGQTPPAALAAAVARVGPRVVFVWSSRPATAVVPPIRPPADGAGRLVLLLGGPGWGRRLPRRPAPAVQIERVADLDGAIDCIANLAR